MDVSAAMEADLNNVDQDGPTTMDIADPLPSLPSTNGLNGPSSDENKFQSAIAAWRSTRNGSVGLIGAKDMQTLILRSLSPSSTIQPRISLPIKEMPWSPGRT